MAFLIEKCVFFLVYYESNELKYFGESMHFQILFNTINICPF